MKLKFEISKNAKTVVVPELNNSIGIYNEHHELEYIIVPVKGGGVNGKM